MTEEKVFRVSEMLRLFKLYTPEKLEALGTPERVLDDMYHHLPGAQQRIRNARHTRRAKMAIQEIPTGKPDKRFKNLT